MDLEKMICWYCSEVIVRAVYGDGYTSEWCDVEGYRGCGHRPNGGDHTPTDPNEE